MAGNARVVDGDGVPAQLGVGQVVEARVRHAQIHHSLRVGLGEQHAAAVAAGEPLALVDDLAEECVAIALEHERHPDPAQLAELELATGEPVSEAHAGKTRARQDARGVEHAISADVIVHADNRYPHAGFERCLYLVVGGDEHDAPRQPAQNVPACEHGGVDDEHGGLVEGLLREQLVGGPPPRRVRHAGARARAVVDEAVVWGDHILSKRAPSVPEPTLSYRTPRGA